MVGRCMAAGMDHTSGVSGAEGKSTETKWETYWQISMGVLFLYRSVLSPKWKH